MTYDKIPCKGIFTLQQTASFLAHPCSNKPGYTLLGKNSGFFIQFEEEIFVDKGLAGGRGRQTKE